MSKPEMLPDFGQLRQAEAKLVKEVFDGATEIKETLHKV